VIDQTPPTRNPLFYAPEDIKLLEVLDSILTRPKSTPSRSYSPDLHPRGIKELTEHKSTRLAYAMIDLLETLERGSAPERLQALKVVHDEVMHDRSMSMRYNAARVMLQVMKELVRVRGEEIHRLDLLRDFQDAASGNPRRIRSQLRKHHLVEMPEAHNQLAFDDHVHDANTKGRKSPSHLILDAWIKGIRHLSVVYYDYIDYEAVTEILEASRIVGIDLRLGVEFTARLHDKPIHLIWIPRGLERNRDLKELLDDPNTRELMIQGKEASAFEHAYLLEVFRVFVVKHLPDITTRFNLNLSHLDEQEFLTFLGIGRLSPVHIAEFTFSKIQPLMKQRFEAIRAEYPTANLEVQLQLTQEVNQLNELVPEYLIDHYLREELNSTRPNTDELPPLRRLSPREILLRLNHLPCRSNITLNPSNLTPQEVLEVLYQGRGLVTHLEIFNLKDWSRGKTEHRETINRIRRILNRGNVIEGKRLVNSLLHEAEGRPLILAEQLKALRDILFDIRTLMSLYRNDPLRSRLGSDSVGRSRHTPGMGLVVLSTLAPSVQRALRRDQKRILPVQTSVYRQITYLDRPNRRLTAQTRATPPPLVPLWWRLRGVVTDHWSFVPNATCLVQQGGSIATLAGQPEEKGNGFTLHPLPRGRRGSPSTLHPRHLNGHVRNILKILLGFIPAFLAFFLTKDWWFLAWFGAPLWFTITGLRNVVQSVVGGGGLMRRSLLRWNDYVSWSRVSDSLLYTGFSVPLLDWLVKGVFLSQSLGITVSSDPWLLYSAIALANGLYISSHNIFRGLQKIAVVGNFFRTILSIPLAYTINFTCANILLSLGLSSAVTDEWLQLWAAVISKFASDLVAAIIEGYADRQDNFLHRAVDYRDKYQAVLKLQNKLETLFPDKDVGEMLTSPGSFMSTLAERYPDLLKPMVIHALDLMYFYLYQPRGQLALRTLLLELLPEDRRMLVVNQRILGEKRIISRLFLDGLCGERFERALAIYLSHADHYLEFLARLELEVVRAAPG